MRHRRAAPTRDHFGGALLPPRPPHAPTTIHRGSTHPRLSRHPLGVVGHCRTTCRRRTDPIPLPATSAAQPDRVARRADVEICVLDRVRVRFRALLLGLVGRRMPAWLPTDTHDATTASPPAIRCRCSGVPTPGKGVSSRSGAAGGGNHIEGRPRVGRVNTTPAA